MKRINHGAIRGVKVGKEAETFGKANIRGNYFSDYVQDNISESAEYERYVNGTQKIDAFAVVDGVAHIVEFKTGGVYHKNHMVQVMGYAHGLRNEGFEDIAITVLYMDHPEFNFSWNVEDAAFAKKIHYYKNFKWFKKWKSKIIGNVIAPKQSSTVKFEVNGEVAFERDYPNAKDRAFMFNYMADFFIDRKEVQTIRDYMMNVGDIAKVRTLANTLADVGESSLVVAPFSKLDEYYFVKIQLEQYR